MPFGLFKNKVVKTCPKCNNKFTCVVKEGCWCENIYVSKEKLAEIRKQYMDCLCKDCLKSFSISEN